jgi:hypothetical protein
VIVDTKELASRRITIVDHSRGMLTRRDEFGEQLPFRPIGFFSYTLSKEGDDTLMEEVKNGMNLITPLEVKEMPRSRATWRGILHFLDRCLAAGMLVHWSLSSFLRAAGGDGDFPSARYLETQMEEEVRRLKDHPAIFGWYLTDEPDRLSIPVESVARAYRLLKRLDPLHPVAAVFCSGAGGEYVSAGLDISMVDPYPIGLQRGLHRPMHRMNPHGEGAARGQGAHNKGGGNEQWWGAEGAGEDEREGEYDVEEIARAVDAFRSLGKPVMLVLQGFGGGEKWRRAPSRQEARVMAYIGALHGSCGEQWFVRSTSLEVACVQTV